MSDYDDSLEIGIAAGLDVPTAMVISERNDDLEPPERPTGGCGCQGIAIAAVLGLTAIILGFLLR